jgi:DNA-binding NarL/FixJ family response regulator
MIDENPSSATDVLALVDDLFFQAKLAETARKLGIMLKTVSTGAALVRELEGAPAGARGDLPRLVVVDLNARQGALEAIEQLQRSGNPIPIIGFLSHVQTDLAQRARAAGCKQVMPRSSFTMNLSDILRQAKS